MPLIPRLRRKKAQPALNPAESTPTRQVSGTSYASSGAIAPPNITELGSALDTKLFERVPELSSGIIASQTYKRMVRDDASVRISLRAGKAPVLGADFYIDPYDQTPENLIIWDFVDYNIFQGMTTPWKTVLDQILKMYESARANSVFELVWEKREWAPKRTQSTANRKQYTMLRKMAYRPDTTIQDFEYDDNGGPTGIIQNAIGQTGQNRQVTIPIEKAVIFVLNQEETVLEGMPMLRSAYKHWWYKNRLYNIDAIQKERHGIGVPDVQVAPGASPADWKLATELGKNLRTNEFAHIVRPPTITVGFAEVSGNLVNVLESATHHDTQIMKNIMVQFLNTVVVGAGGGRADSATQMDMFMKAMRYVANTICDYINMYLIPELVSYNFQTDQFPQIKVRNVGEVKDIQMWAAAMRNLIDVGAISVDEQTEAWIRDQMDMPKLQSEWKPLEDRPARVSETITRAIQTALEGDGNGSTNGTGRGNHSPNGGAGYVGKSPSSAAV